VTTCELCEAAPITPQHYEDDVCWIADCEACDVPMVVWRQHGASPPAAELDHMLAALARVASAVLGAEQFKIDRVMRQIPDHFHAHARSTALLGLFRPNRAPADPSSTP
jgi:hypothetical protein